jgi:hypothetical protein
VGATDTASTSGGSFRHGEHEEAAAGGRRRRKIGGGRPPAVKAEVGADAVVLSLFSFFNPYLFLKLYNLALSISFTRK